MPDYNGYPTEEELRTIAEWPWNDLKGMMEYVRSIWWMPDWGFEETMEGVYSISTGGWSGNEDIIGAMKDNRVWWSTWWAVHERGGHYKFYK